MSLDPGAESPTKGALFLNPIRIIPTGQRTGHSPRSLYEQLQSPYKAREEGVRTLRGNLTVTRLHEACAPRQVIDRHKT